MRSLSLLALAGVVFSSVASAAVVPNCYNKPGIVNGGYEVQANVATMSKSNILKVLALSQFTNGVQPAGFPTVIGEELMVINLNTMDSVHPTRPAKVWQAEVMKSLAQLAQVPGVTLGCSVEFKPAGR